MARYLVMLLTITCWALALLPASAASNKISTGIARNAWKFGSYEVVVGHDTISLLNANETVWSSALTWPIISASHGEDIVESSDGAFNITNVDKNKCQGQNITGIDISPLEKANSSTSIIISGHLLDCGTETAPYSLKLWLPEGLPNRVSFRVEVDDNSTSNTTLNKVFLELPSTQHEGIYGLGAQASFGSLKNQTVPVFTREQGVGRGDEPITSLQNEGGEFHGGDEYTTYTANPSYITTNGGLF